MSVNRQFYWVLKAGNGEVVAVSETYTTKQSAKRSIELIKDLAPRATVVDQAVAV